MKSKVVNVNEIGTKFGIVWKGLSTRHKNCSLVVASERSEKCCDLERNGWSPVDLKELWFCWSAYCWCGVYWKTSLLYAEGYDAMVWYKWEIYGVERWYFYILC